MLTSSYPLVTLSHRLLRAIHGYFEPSMVTSSHGFLSKPLEACTEISGTYKPEGFGLSVGPELRFEDGVSLAPAFRARAVPEGASQAEKALAPREVSAKPQ